MKIHSLSVNNFKIHREQRIEFSDQVTLITGPNEAGKSTLLDALNVAFFLRSKGKSKEHEALRSELHTGHPKVEVVFSVGGETYTVEKLFSGSGGSSRLVQHGGQVLVGDAVEEQLAVLLKVNEARKNTSPWAHLFVQQRRSGDNPAEHAEAQSEYLVRRLQSEGGAAVLLSVRDQVVASYFEKLHDELFKQDGKPRVGSFLAQAISAEEEARAKLKTAEDQCAKLTGAADDYARANSVITTKTNELETMREEIKLKEEIVEQAKALESDLRTHFIEARNCEDKYKRLQSEDEQIADIQSDLQQQQNKLSPFRRDMEAAEKELENATKEHSTAENFYTVAAQKETDEHLRNQLTRTDLTVFEKAKIVEGLEKNCEGIAKRREQIQKLEKSIDSLAVIDEAALDGLVCLEEAVNTAKAKLEATATRLRVVAADVPVRRGNEPLPVGSDVILIEESEIMIGDGTRILLTPGGESSLQKAKDKMTASSDALRQSLRDYGFVCVNDARKVLNERRHLAKQLEDEKLALKEIDADKIDKELEDARMELAQAKNTLGNLQQGDRGFARAGTILEAKKNFAEAENHLNQAVKAKVQAENALKTARDAKSKAQTARDRCKDEHAEVSKNVETAKAKLEILLKNHGDDQTRQKKLASALNEKNIAEAVLKNIQSKLEEMQVEQNRLSLERFKKAMTEAESMLHDAEIKRATSESALQRDSDRDPDSEFRRAKVIHDNADKTLTGARRTAEARKLLHMLFVEQKTQLAHQYTRPLIEKINAYLQCLFGPHVEAGVDLKDDRIAGIKISRNELGNVAFDFEKLSGGTAEQVAAAARLAMAEVLASDHDGQLPVVFDDAFTNADPERVKKLQDMLYLAANNGLQIIILSCNPSDYAGSGAKEIHLSKLDLAASHFPHVAETDTTVI